MSGNKLLGTRLTNSTQPRPKKASFPFLPLADEDGDGGHLRVARFS